MGVGFEAKDIKILIWGEHSIFLLITNSLSGANFIFWLLVFLGDLKVDLEIVHFKVNFVAERKIIFHGKYFTDFYIQQTAKVQEKIDFVLMLIKTVQVVPERFLKHLTGTDGLYEIRVECGSNIFRIFCCFDKGNLVVLFNVFQKKTQKTPKQELEMAVKLMKEYFGKKEKDNDLHKVSSRRKK